MRNRGASPADVARAAKADGVPVITEIRLLRDLFGLSLLDVKRARLEADGVTLEEHEASLVPAIEEALRRLPEP